MKKTATTLRLVLTLGIITALVLISAIHTTPNTSYDSVGYECTEEAKPFELADGWHFKSGTDPTWALPCDNPKLTCAGEQPDGFQPVNVPAHWETYGNKNLDGHGWFRVEFATPSPISCRPLGLSIGGIKHASAIFLNGYRVGGLGGFPPYPTDAGDIRQVVPLPRHVLKAPGEKNLIAIHVYDWGNWGGIVHGPVVIGDLVSMSSRINLLGLLLLLAPVFLLIAGCQQLAVWVLQPERKASFFFFWYSFGAAMIALPHTAIPTLTGMDLNVLEAFYWLGILTSPLLFVLFANELFSSRSPLWTWIPAYLLFAIGIGTFVGFRTVQYEQLFIRHLRPIYILAFVQVVYLLVKPAFERKTVALWMLGVILVLVGVSMSAFYAGFSEVFRPTPVILCWVALAIVSLVTMAKTAAENTARVVLAKKELELRVQERTTQLNAANQNLIARNQDLGVFAQTLAHDLRGPMGTIKSLSELLISEMDTDQKDENQQTAVHIRESVIRMNGLLDGIARLARVGRDIQPVQHIELSIVIDDVIALLSGEIQNREANIQVEEELPSVWGFPSDLTELVMNLVENAIKHNPKSQPKVWMRPLTMDQLGESSLPQNTVGFAIEDDGPGIDVSARERLFQPFVRGLDALGEGHGVGLSVAMRVVSQMEGKIWIEDRPGGGTRICCIFPAETRDESDTTKAADEVHPPIGVDP
ncbi:MAG: hypothetical protein CMH54_07405 [Myxococcales bacterium]|nr:hypothetical protein [Myxococcales bacterium]